MMDRIFKGARSPLVGLKFLFSGPRLFPFALIPMLFFTGALLGSTIWLVGEIGPAVGSFVAWGTGFLQSLPLIGAWFVEGSALVSAFNYLASAALFLVSFIAILYFCYVGTRLVLVPFSGLMAERTLAYLGKLPPEDLVFAERVRRFLRSVLTGMIQVLVLSMIGVTLFLFALIPGLQPVVAFIGLMIVAFDCSDYALECADLNFRQKVRVFFNHLPEYSGFALTAGLTFAVPVLNLFFLPALVIGAASMTAGFRGVWKTTGKEG